MTIQTAARHNVSKSRIGDLALASALEIERARSNGSFDPAPLQALAQALKTTSLSAGSGPVAAMHPGYFEPLARLYLSLHSKPPESLEAIRAQVDTAVQKLEEVIDAGGKGGDADDLVTFCLQLHKEFVSRPAAEARFAKTHRDLSNTVGVR